MKETLKLDLSIAKQNRTFTIGLLLLFVVMAALIGVSKTIPKSMNDSGFFLYYS